MMVQISLSFTVTELVQIHGLRQLFLKLKKKKLHYLQTKKNISNVLELKVEKEHRRRKGEAVESLRITDMGRTLEIISNFWSSSWRELRLQYRVTSPKLQIQPATKPGRETLSLGIQSCAFSMLSIFILSPPVPTPLHAHSHMRICTHVPTCARTLPPGHAAAPATFSTLLWSAFLGTCPVALLCNLIQSSVLHTDSPPLSWTTGSPLNVTFLN